MSGYVQIDEWFSANDAAVERKYGSADKLGILEKLLSEGGVRTCRAPGCEAKVEDRYSYCDKCGLEQKRLKKREWKQKKRKQEMLAMLGGGE